MVVRPQLRDETAKQLEKIKERHEYESLDRAIMHLIREKRNLEDELDVRKFNSGE